MNVRLLTVFIVFYTCCLANPLLNLNTEEYIVYENLESSSAYPYFNFSIKPFSLEKAYVIVENPGRIKTYMNALSAPGYYWKPLNSLTIKVMHTTEDFFLLENSAGTVLRKGINLYNFADGFLSTGKNFVLYYQIRHVKRSRLQKVELFRGYAKFKIGKVSLQAGKDNVHLGPGRFGLFLSSTAEPFFLIKIQTEESFKVFGKWDFIFLKGWLKEKRKDIDNPNLLALRVVWKPFDTLELGGTRSALFGGKGRPGLKLTEYPKMIIGSEENIPYSKYDSDGYGGWDISLNLPVNRIFKSVKTLRVYYQEAGTDIKAWWQKEDRGKFYFPFGFKLLFMSYVAGFLMSTEKHILRLEFTKVSDKWYIHHIYGIEGYTYRGIPLGHPYGRDSRSLILSHRFYFSKSSSFKYQLGLYEKSLTEKPSMKRYFISLGGEKRLKSLILRLALRYDRTHNYDKNPSPMHFKIVREDKNFFSFQFAISWRL